MRYSSVSQPGFRRGPGFQRGPLGSAEFMKALYFQVLLIIFYKIQINKVNLHYITDNSLKYLTKMFFKIVKVNFGVFLVAKGAPGRETLSTGRRDLIHNAHLRKFLSFCKMLDFKLSY